MEIWVEEESVRLERLQAVRRRRMARGLEVLFTLELLDEMVDKGVVKILTAKVGITSSGFDLKNTLLNDQARRKHQMYHHQDRR